MQNKAEKWVFEALQHVTGVFPFPIIGIDSDNGSEFINDHLFRYCGEQHITFTRSRSGNKNDGAHVEQKNWARIRELVQMRQRLPTPGGIDMRQQGGNATRILALCDRSDGSPPHVSLEDRGDSYL